jgi:hypothetical protein
METLQDGFLHCSKLSLASLYLAYRSGNRGTWVGTYFHLAFTEEALSDNTIGRLVPEIFERDYVDNVDM